jgi:hypothetical protein
VFSLCGHRSSLHAEGLSLAVSLPLEDVSECKFEHTHNLTSIEYAVINKLVEGVLISYISEHKPGYNLPYKCAQFMRFSFTPVFISAVRLYAVENTVFSVNIMISSICFLFYSMDFFSDYLINSRTM